MFENGICNTPNTIAKLYDSSPKLILEIKSELTNIIIVTIDDKTTIAVNPVEINLFLNNKSFILK